jgi:hypothetical protein
MTTSSMSLFIVRIELHPSDKEQAYSFSRIYRNHDGLRYHLPTSEYCITSASSVEAIRDLAAAATGRVTTLFMLMVSETTRIAIAGLVPVKEETLPLPLQPATGSIPLQPAKAA